MAKYRKVEMVIHRAKGYGQYYLQAQYRGKFISVRTTDSEMYDWLEDDFDEVKHLEAKQRAYMMIVNAYKEMQ